MNGLSIRPFPSYSTISSALTRDLIGTYELEFAEVLEVDDGHCPGGRVDFRFREGDELKQ